MTTDNNPPDPKARTTANAKRYRDARVAEGNCAACGKPREPPALGGASPLRCAVCMQKQRDYGARIRRAGRVADDERFLPNGDPLPMGGASAPLGPGARTLKIALTEEAYRALETLKRRRRERTGVPSIGRKSEIIRDAIRASQKNGGAFAAREPFCYPGWYVTVTLPRDLYAYLGHEAARLGGNPNRLGKLVPSRARVVRLILCQAINPVSVATVGRRRRRADD